MKAQEPWYTNEKRKLLCKERYFSTSHHYFFELKEAKNGSKYIIISQRKKVGDEFIGTKIRLFADEMLEFHRVLHRLISLAVQESDQTVSGAAMQASAQDVRESSPYEQDTFAVHAPASPTFFRKATSRIRQFWKREPHTHSHASSELRPAFFQHLPATSNWRHFEEYTYYLLKVLGIQTLYHFLGERQAGRADGFFKIGNLAVLYDCTLRTGQIEDEKQDQIMNYCHQLHQGYIDISQDIREEFTHYHKQVWIITRGTTRRIKLMNSIEVKEIAVSDLMRLYDERLLRRLSDDMLETTLRSF